MPMGTSIHKEEVHLGQDGGDDTNTGYICISGSLNVPGTVSRPMRDCDMFNLYKSKKVKNEHTKDHGHTSREDRTLRVNQEF